MEEKRARIKELVDKLNAASRAYYQESREIMSNYEYDALYDELKSLEEETGIVLSQSPTQNVGYEILSELPKERHASPMLSLDKTKDREALASWLGDKDGLLSWKLDGLTIVLTYRDGTLFKAVTRGNGEIGEVITPNARVFANVPLQIPFTGELILRGEAVISYADFAKMNDEIADEQAKYKNPRNLCSGSVRQLNSEITAKRNVHFIAFSLVSAEGVDFENSRETQYKWLKAQGFDVVEYKRVTRENCVEAIAEFEEKIAGNAFPSDGLVMLFDDIAYGVSLGRTAKFPRNSIAFKWSDETAETTLLEIEWSASRTGLINPVAVFAPVELEGTTVSRASVHNVSIVEQLGLGIGDTITVYKANMIIPQIAENLTRSGKLHIPEVCPVCGQPTSIQQSDAVKVLMCTNPECAAKRIKSFSLMVSRDALNIDGCSEATLEKFIAAGFLHRLPDIYNLRAHSGEIMQMEGFGEKSCTNLLDAIDRSRETTPERLIYALGIPGVGISTAKLLMKHFDDEIDQLRHASAEAILEVDGIGEIMAAAITEWFADMENVKLLEDLLACLKLQKRKRSSEGSNDAIAGKVFVITGSLVHFENRSACKELIESLGGKVTGSVSAKTNYLINNDTQSNSSKNKKARELGIPVISEEEFRKMCGISS